MKNLKIETRESKAGNDYKLITGEGTYYLSALKRAKGNNQTETIDVPGETVEFTKHLLYNRVLKGFICKMDSFPEVEAGLNALTLPDNWKAMVKKILPKANIFKSEEKKQTAKKQSKAAPKVNDTVNILASKLSKYDSWDNVPKDSISKLQTACEESGVKIAQVRKVFESNLPDQSEDIKALEL